MLTYIDEESCGLLMALGVSLVHSLPSSHQRIGLTLYGNSRFSAVPPRVCPSLLAPRRSQAPTATCWVKTPRLCAVSSYCTSRASALHYSKQPTQHRAFAIHAFKAADATSSLLDVLALDLEYTHLKLQDGSVVSAPAWVCVVDKSCKPVFNSYINPQV